MSQVSCRLLGPRVTTSGPIINEKGGRNLNPFQRLVETPAEARAAVRSQYDRGYPEIKVYSNLAIENYQAVRDEAKTLGMKVMVGCMTESSIGISAIAQILPLLDYVDMDGALLLKEDIATGVCIEHGIVHYSPKNGTGAELKLSI